MNQPTRTHVSYAFGNSHVYAHAAIDAQEPPPPAALSFMNTLGVPVEYLGWHTRPPFPTDSWDSRGPLDGMHVLAILRVVNSQL